MSEIERGRIVGERGDVPMADGTAYHEAGHAAAIEHFGLGWIICAPDHEENFMSQTKAVTLGEPLPDFTLEDAAVIALAGWAAECHFLGTWENIYVREGAEHDFVILDELDEDKHGPVTERAKKLVAAEWQRVEEIAAEVLAKFG